MSCFRHELLGFIAVLLALPHGATAASLLGSAANFAVLGGAAVTNAGASQIVGDIGVAPGTSITGLATIALIGAAHAGDTIAAQAQADAGSAYGALAARPFDTDLSGTDLGGIGVLTPGVYKFGTSAQLTGALLLDFTGNPGGAFVFQIGTTLTTTANSSILVAGGSSASAIYWLVGTAATLGGNSRMAGNILAQHTISLGDAARILCGRGLARQGAATLISNLITNDCSVSDFGGGTGDFGSRGFDGGAVPGVPDPATWGLLLTGFGCVGAAQRRRRAHAPMTHAARG